MHIHTYNTACTYIIIKDKIESKSNFKSNRHMENTRNKPTPNSCERVQPKLDTFVKKNFQGKGIA